MQIGVSGGLSEPVTARIKTVSGRDHEAELWSSRSVGTDELTSCFDVTYTAQNKGGLGSGYSVTRNEAQRMGRAASPANFW